MKRLSKRRLQFLFLSFFLLLVIPSLILSYNAYEKIRWQTFHQFQLTAQSLVSEMDNILNTALKKEEARSDSDYNFLVVEGDLNANFLQRSILSKLPVESDFPGIIGYFQVDSLGKFSSPLLPTAQQKVSLYGITPEDKLLRSQLAFSLQSILVQNQLVSQSNENMVTSTTISPTIKLNQKHEGQLVVSEYLMDSPSASPVNESKSDILENSLSSVSSDEDNSNNKLKDATRLGFSQLESKEQQQQISKNLGIEQGYAKQYADKISQKKQAYELTQAEEQRTAKFSKNDQRAKEADNQRAKRKEQNYLPQQKSIQLSSKRDEKDNEVDLVTAQLSNINDVEISLFESELEPFKFSLLKSGHFVAYRQVWRNDKRLIQGAILLVDDFFEQVFKHPFERSALSAMTNLSVAYGGNILKTFSKTEISYRSRKIPLNGEVLLSSNLSDPFTQLSLAFNITDMPSGATGQFILIIASILVLALVFGTYALYRLTYRQSLLAQQHQDFISSVSHELKTPITSIKMYGEILKQGWADQTKKEEYYDFIYSEAERLSRLISNILQISKVSRNSLNLDSKLMTISEISNIITSKIDSQIKQSSFEYSVIIDKDLENKQIKIDPDAFIQIMINLVDNAIKYSTKSSTKKIEINFKQNKNNILISVRDYGPGIKKDQTTKIFELFYRIGNELTRESKGTGIGLALVNELTQAMNGKVKVVNRDVGAEFILQFPGV